MSSLHPWLRSARYDGWLMLAPPFAARAVVALPLATYRRQSAAFLLVAWVGLLIEVVHVYGTLFQTCFDPR